MDLNSFIKTKADELDIIVTDSDIAYIKTIGKGNPGAIVALINNKDCLDDIMLLNISGPAIWVLYKHYCNTDKNAFKNMINNISNDKTIMGNYRGKTVNIYDHLVDLSA